MKQYKILISIIILAVASFGLNGCSLLKKRVEKTEKQEFKVNSTGKKRLVLTNANGDLTVKHSNDSTSIRISAEKTGKVKVDDKDKPLENVIVTVDTTGDEIRIKTDIRNNNGIFKRDKGGEVNYEIEIPNDISLDIENTNGDMKFSDVSGDIKVELVNGDVGFSKCTGYVSVKGVNCDVYVNFDSTAGVSIETINGEVKLGNLKNISAKFDIETEHGRVKHEGLTLKDPSSNRQHLYGLQNDGRNEIKVRALNGRVILSGDEVRIKDVRKGDHWDFILDWDDDDNERNSRK